MSTSYPYDPQGATHTFVPAIPPTRAFDPETLEATDLGLDATDE